MFLKVCSNLLKSQLKYVKRDGAMSTFVKKYSMVFFGTTIEITHEFLYKAFPNSPACSSGTIINYNLIYIVILIYNKNLFSFYFMDYSRSKWFHGCFK